MKCIKGHEIEILKSILGYYVGTMENGFPYCRISNYKHEHGKLSDYNYSRMACAMEIQYCNGCRNCATGEPFFE